MGEDAVSGDPFRALGLPASAGLTDGDVRAAWRRIAATTHPDREDGGDLERFSAAAAAYETLRTSFGRGEALADLVAGRARVPARAGRRRRRPPRRRAGGGAHRAARHQAGTGHPAGNGHAADTGFPGDTGYPASPGHPASAGLPGDTGYLAGSGHRVGPGRPGGTRHRRGAWRPGGERRSSSGDLIIGRGLALRVAVAAMAAATVAAVIGWTPATIGLLAGALTFTGWALWRQGGWGR
jgi:curved DNA-binding protein CbpA